VPNDFRQRETATLKRQLGLMAATAVIAGQTIGVGIFLTPAGMAATLGSPLLLLLVWLIIGTMTLCGALCYGALACVFPQTGGTYVYLRNIYGPRLAFLYGWMCMVVLDPGLCAVLAIGLSSYLSRIIPLSASDMKITAIATVALLGLINALGTRLGAAFMNTVTWSKIALLASLPILALAFGNGDWSNLLPLARPRESAVPLMEAMAGALVAAFFSFGGWWELSRIAGEIKNPEKNLPRALVFGVLIVLLVYLLVSAVFLYVVPVGSIVNDQTFVAQFGERLFGQSGDRMLAGIVILSIVSSLAALMLASPRVYVAMAEDGVFFKEVAELSSRFGTPARAIALQVALACVLILLGSFEQIISYFIFISVLFVGMASAGVFYLQKRRQIPIRFGYPITPIVFSTLVVTLLVLLLVGRPQHALLGVAITIAGWPLYALTRRRAQRHDATQ
jgi:basic amino acid/polyamine antiporter, APA family